MRGSVAMIAFAAWLCASTAPADTLALEARLSCDPVLGPGRVRCALEITPPPATRLSWADALVVTAPAFARPLRVRVHRAALPESGKVEILLALMASGPGSGQLSVRARGVVCPLEPRGGRCRPLAKTVSIEFSVGTRSD